MSDDETKKAMEAVERDTARLRDIAAMVRVHFQDWVLIVRTETICASSISDKTWALGAAELYVAHVKDEALLNQIKADDQERGT